MSTAVANGYVTTQGLHTYIATNICMAPRPKPPGMPIKQRDVGASSTSSLPLSTPLSSFVTSFPKTTAAAAPVCTIAISTIAPEIVSEYELLRSDDGKFRFVQPTVDQLFYDVSYFNAELKRTIPLGRFQDPATAALAHAIARSSDSQETCRVVPFAAQEYIERLFATRTDNDDAETAGRTADDVGKPPVEDEIDFAELFDFQG